MDSVPNLSCSIIPAMISASSHSNWLDEDLIPEILKRLPVKSLLRFRSVCKYWKSLISSSSFITLHSSSASSTTPANLKPYLRRRRPDPDEPYGDYVLYRSQQEHILRFPFRFRHSRYLSKFDFIDLVKGLICISYSLSRYSHYMILWNAAIHKYLPLPLQPFPSTEILDLDIECTAHSYNYVIGFGYDSRKDDFKVVRIWIPIYPCGDCGCKSLLPAFDVYSYRQGVWRVSIDETINVFQIHNIKSCFVNGFVHWLVEDHEYLTKHFVLRFDCELEEFSSMELPKEIDHVDQTNSNLSMDLLEYGGMLSLLAHWDGHVEVWVMEDHAKTWKKLYEISEDTVLNWNIDVSQSSYQKLAPFGPVECIKFRWNDELYDDILCYNVYEESMVLMNDTLSLSYTKAEIVRIDNSDSFRRFQFSDSDSDSPSDPFYD